MRESARDEATIEQLLGSGTRAADMQVSVNVHGPIHVYLGNRPSGAPELEAAVQQLQKLDPEQLRHLAQLAAGLRRE